MSENTRSSALLAARWPSLLALAAWPVGLILWIALQSALVHRDTSLETTPWQILREQLENMFWNGDLLLEEVRSDKDGEKFRIRATERISIAEYQELRQQIERFNSLSRAEQLQESDVPALGRELVSVSGFEGRDGRSGFRDLLDKWAQARDIRSTQRPPCMIIVRSWAKEDFDEEEKAVDAGALPHLTGALGKHWIGSLHPFFHPPQSFDAKEERSSPPPMSWGNNRILAGPAWVMGRYRVVCDAQAPIPWVADMADALAAEWASRDKRGLSAELYAKRYGRLTLDPSWQTAAQSFTQEKGFALHKRVLQGLRPRDGNRLPTKELLYEAQRRLPPAVALSVISIPDGAVLGLGGWPRMTSQAEWVQGNEGSDTIAPRPWLVRQPKLLQRCFGGDRNFDLELFMGSSTKPLFAAASLKARPFLADRLFTVTAEHGERERQLFGVEVTEKGERDWEAGHGKFTKDGWTDFDGYLSQSDNRYHVRLNFLALAEAGSSGVQLDPSTSSISQNEGLGTKRGLGRTFPRFPAKVGFSAARPHTLSEVHLSAWATAFGSLYPVGMMERSPYRFQRYSIWSGDESHDLRGRDGESPSPHGLFAAVSPEIANLHLDSERTPREHVTTLLGGRSNRWSNVDFAAAFASTVIGQPVVPHLSAGVSPHTTRESFPTVAERLRRGMENAALSGTAKQLKAVVEPMQKKWNVRCYAKTGTLPATLGERSTSRLVMALVRWTDEKQTLVDRGLVLSLAGERANEPGRTGEAVRWMVDFLRQPDTQQCLQRYFESLPSKGDAPKGASR